MFKSNQIYLWGAGSLGRLFLLRNKHFLSISGFIDQDPQKHGESIDGVVIYSPKIITTNKSNTIVILCSMYQDEIRASLKSLGFPPDKTYDCYDFFDNQLRSLFFFSANSSASVTCVRILQKLMIGRLRAKLYEEETLKLEQEGKRIRDIKDYQEKGFLYRIRSLFNVNSDVDLTRFRILYCWRDPRDMLVSTYYSQKYIHDIPKGKENRWKEIRKKLENVDVDSYVIENAIKFKNIYYTPYKNFFEKNIDIQSLKLSFDLLARDLRLWIQLAANFLDDAINDDVIDEIFKEELYLKSQLDPRRSSNPGRFRNELKSTTIAFVDNEFSDILQWLYDQEKDTFHLKKQNVLI